MVKSIRETKFQNVVPNTAKVIYARNKNILSISNNVGFFKQLIYKNYHIIDVHVNTKVLKTGLVIPSGTKRLPTVESTQWCKQLS